MRPVHAQLIALMALLLPAQALGIRLTEPVEAQRYKEGDEGEINPFLRDAVEDTVTRSIAVAGERAGYIVLDTGGKQYYPGTFILFFRKTPAGLDMMARGEVTFVESGEALVRLDLEDVIKVPVEGDLAVPLAPPIFGEESADEERTDATQHQAPELPGEPGHIEFRYGQFGGSLASETNGSTNLCDSSTTGIPNYCKIVPTYTFPYLHGEWYPEFMWRWGIEYEKWSGIFPTSTYAREDVVTQQDYSRFVLNYRFRKVWEGKLRPQMRMIFATDKFDTENTDENVISSIYTSIGIGTRVSWEFVNPTWRTRRWQPFALHRIYGDFSFFPMVTAEDTTLSRGTDAQATALEWRIGGTAFIYFYWMPWIKRFVVEGFYGHKAYSLAFSGATKSEAASPITIAPGATGVESYTYWGVSVGVRLDDIIGHFLKPPEKKE